MSWVISLGQFSNEVSLTLSAIVAAEISPELVPVGEGQRPQSTEAAIGPYALQDFNLYLYPAVRISPLQDCLPGDARLESKFDGRLAGPVCWPISDNITNWPISESGWKCFETILCLQSV